MWTLPQAVLTSMMRTLACPTVSYEAQRGTFPSVASVRIVSLTVPKVSKLTPPSLTVPYTAVISIIISSPVSASVTIYVQT